MPQEPKADLIAISIPRWEHPDSRKKLRQLETKLAEFIQEVKTAQASMLLITKPEYLDRQARVFMANVNAIELAQTLVSIAAAGSIMVPGGWLKPPPEKNQKG